MSTIDTVVRLVRDRTDRLNSSMRGHQEARRSMTERALLVFGAGILATAILITLRASNGGVSALMFGVLILTPSAMAFYSVSAGGERMRDSFTNAKRHYHELSDVLRFAYQFSDHRSHQPIVAEHDLLAAISKLFDREGLAQLSLTNMTNRDLIARLSDSGPKAAAMDAELQIVSQLSELELRQTLRYANETLQQAKKEFPRIDEEGTESPTKPPLVAPSKDSPKQEEAVSQSEPTPGAENGGQPPPIVGVPPSRSGP